MEKYKKKERLFALLPVIILVLTVFFAGSPVKAEQKTHTIWFFFENVCASCHEEDDFYDLFNRCVTAEEKASISYDIRTYNVFKSADEAVFEETLKENGKVKTDVTLPVLYIDGQWLSGYDKIEKELHGVLFEEKTASESSENNIENSEVSTEKTSRWALPEIDAEGDDRRFFFYHLFLQCLRGDQGIFKRSSGRKRLCLDGGQCGRGREYPAFQRACRSFWQGCGRWKSAGRLCR